MFDIVYSWGVLHHTGSMWDAIDRAMSLVGPYGLLWISIYQKGPKYARDLALKQKYNAASASEKRWMERKWIAKEMFRRAKRFRNPWGWFQKTGRGMNSYHDLIDWLGGLPYEVADANEIIQFGRQRELVLEQIGTVKEGGCSNYHLRRIPGLPKLAETLLQDQRKSA
jgi:2-polyprenyl-6-hydroxyphenyl methylase/3-demethylubiquinone-9 3-methyltransferase